MSGLTCVSDGISAVTTGTPYIPVACRCMSTKARDAHPSNRQIDLGAAIHSVWSQVARLGSASLQVDNLELMFEIGSACTAVGDLRTRGEGEQAWAGTTR